MVFHSKKLQRYKKNFLHKMLKLVYEQTDFLFRTEAKKDISFEEWEKITNYANLSFSQEGEDRIVKMLLQSEKIVTSDVTYLDIGCNDPIALNNTFLLSRSFNVKKGVLVEPNTKLSKQIAKVRPNDIVINKGVGVVAGELSYYDFGDYNVLNTCSDSEKDFIIKQGFPLISTTKVEIVPINDLLRTHFPDRRLDFLSIDIEGQDEEIVKSIDYDFIRPALICIETAVYKGGKNDTLPELIEFFKSKGYYLTADTSLNSIFIDAERSIHKRFLNDLLFTHDI